MTENEKSMSSNLVVKIYLEGTKKKRIQDQVD